VQPVWLSQAAIKIAAFAKAEQGIMVEARGSRKALNQLKKSGSRLEDGGENPSSVDGRTSSAGFLIWRQE
jgi:hypothetical protein